MRAYSHTQLRKFAECPLSWKLEKLDGLRPERSKAMIIGAGAHEAIDLYLRKCVESGVPSDPEIVPAVMAAAKLEDASPDDQREIRRLLGRFAESFALESKRLLTERKLAFDAEWKPVEWFAPDVRFRGVLDWIDRPKAGVIRIRDWKTGWRIPSRSEFEHDEQLATYALLASRVDKKAEEFQVSLWHVRTGYEQGPKVYERYQLEDVRADIEERMAQIDAATDFPATPGDHCERCGVRAHCPLYQAGTDGEIPDDTQTMADRYFAAKAYLKDLETRLKMRLEVEGPIPVGGGKVLGFQAKPTVTIPEVQAAIAELIAVHRVSKEDAWRALSLSKTAVKKMLKAADRMDVLDDFLQRHGLVNYRNYFTSFKEEP